jgi:glycosyltransferase involved in cell wall biosynthesis
MSSRDLVLIRNFLPDRQESMLRFGQLLLEGLQARGWNVTTWSPRPRFANLAGTYRYGGIPKYLGYLDKFFVFPRTIRRAARRSKPDTVYHIVDHSNAVYVRPLRGFNVLVTCHDLLQIRSALGEFPQHRVSRSGQKYQQWILNSLREAPRIVCISGKTRKDLQRLTGLGDAVTPVIYMGLNYPYRPMPPAEAAAVMQACLERQGKSWGEIAGLPRGFLVGIGGAHWYKNRTGLIATFAALQQRPDAPTRLVYVGPPLDDEQLAVLRANHLENAMIRLIGVSNEELRAIYSLGRALLFPSWEEGFGWPIAEAQACGCPVFTSNREPMTEIGGPAAVYVDPADPQASADVITRAWSDTERMRAEGFRQAQLWSTERMLTDYERVYQARP